MYASSPVLLRGQKGHPMNERNLALEVVDEVKKAIVGKDNVLVL